MGKDHFVIFVKTLFPLDNPPAIRTASIVKYMLREGWDVHLFAWKSDPIDHDGHPYLKDAKLHVMGVEPGRNYFKYFSHIFRTRRFMQGELEGLEGTVCFFASVPQMQALLLGAMLKKRMPLTLVEELRDVYSINRTRRRGAIYRLALRTIEKAAMKRVDRFIFVTPVIKSEYVGHFAAAIPKIARGAVIYNSVDEEKLQGIFPDGEPSKKRSDIVFTYIGNLYGSRNLDAFLSALGALKGEMDVSHVRIRIIGRISPENRAVLDAIVREHGLAANVEWQEPLPHMEAMRAIAQSDFSILVTHRQGSEYAIPSKLFEYMYVRKPIFAITRDPLVIQLIEEHKSGICCDFKEEDIAANLRKAIEERDSLQKQVGPFPEEFSRAFTTRQISDFIKQ